MVETTHLTECNTDIKCFERGDARRASPKTEYMHVALTAQYTTRGQGKSAAATGNVAPLRDPKSLHYKMLLSVGAAARVVKDDIHTIYCLKTLYYARGQQARRLRPHT